MRRHFAEFHLVAAKGRENVDRLRAAHQPSREGEEDPLPVVHHMAQLCLDEISDLSRRIAELDAQIAATSGRSRFAAQLQKMPGVSPVTVLALVALASPVEPFLQGRDFSAWLRLVPRQHSSGGKQWLSRSSKSGRRDIRRLLILDAKTVISRAKT